MQKEGSTPHPDPHHPLGEDERSPNRSMRSRGVRRMTGGFVRLGLQTLALHQGGGANGDVSCRSRDKLRTSLLVPALDQSSCQSHSDRREKVQTQTAHARPANTQLLLLLLALLLHRHGCHRLAGTFSSAIDLFVPFTNSSQAPEIVATLKGHKTKRGGEMKAGYQGLFELITCEGL